MAPSLEAREISSLLVETRHDVLITRSCSVTDSRGPMGIAELLTAINGQSSVPVSETELKDALRMLGSDVSINWTARTVQLSEVEP